MFNLTHRHTRSASDLAGTVATMPPRDLAEYQRQPGSQLNQLDDGSDAQDDTTDDDLAGDVSTTDQPVTPRGRWLKHETRTGAALSAKSLSHVAAIKAGLKQAKKSVKALQDIAAGKEVPFAGEDDVAAGDGAIDGGIGGATGDQVGPSNPAPGTPSQDATGSRSLLDEAPPLRGLPRPAVERLNLPGEVEYR